MMMDGCGGGMLLWSLLLLALIGVGIWLAVRAFRGGGTSTPTTDASSQDPTTALQILEDRFARGEIDHEDFDQRRAALRRRD